MCGVEIPECIAKKWREWERTGERALLRDVGEILWVEMNYGYSPLPISEIPAKVLLVLKLEGIIK